MYQSLSNHLPNDIVKYITWEFIDPTPLNNIKLVRTECLQIIKKRRMLSELLIKNDFDK